MPRTWNILVFTGGGCYCYGQALVASRCSYDLLDVFDFFGGTSGGAINALGLVHGSQAYLRVFYERFAERVFAGRWWRFRKPFCPRYPDRELNEALRHVLVHDLGDACKPVYVCAHDLLRGRPKVFRSTDQDDAGWPMWEVARASTAAQTYFAPWKGYADGGIFFNDPVAATMAGVHKDFGIPLADMRVFSIGAGLRTVNRAPGNPWNPITYLYLILADLLDGGAVFQQRTYAKQFLPEGAYTHVDFERLARGFDDPAVIREIPEAWAERLERASGALEAFCEEALDNGPKGEAVPPQSH